MTQRTRIWGLSMWALVGMPMTVALLFHLAWSNREVPEPVGLGVLLLCLASGALSINLLPLWTSPIRLMLSVAYISTMPFALAVVALWLGCGNGACY